VFGNKGYGWKLAAGFAVIALLGVYASNRGDGINPAVWRCLAEPARWNGTTLWIPSSRVVSTRDGEYEIETAETRIRVTGTPPGAPGSRVTVVGVFRAEGPRLEARRARTLPSGRGIRWVMEIVSIVVVLGVLANFARHFLFRPQLLQARGEER